jgi:hypothetical protein
MEHGAWSKKRGAYETFEKCSILFKFKPACALHADREGENFKCRNTLSISRLKI